MPVKTIAMKRLEGQKRTFYMDEHGGYQHEYVDFYPAELVEKIISDLSNQVLEGRRKWNTLFFRSQLRRRELWDKRHAAVTEKDKELRHANYKRCLAMAKWCFTKSNYHYIVGREEGGLYAKENFRRSNLYNKWRQRWLEIAKQFKEGK